ncbi:Fc.00g047230.m01.CDS01 [Cosmosporella sp. VM-42]
MEARRYPRCHDRDFDNFVKRNSERGLDGNGDEALFIRPSDLDRHWDDDTIDKVLNNPQQEIRAPPQAIAEYYLVIFSILVYIGMPEFIVDFVQNGWDDEKLPMIDRGPFNDSPATSEMIDEFRKKQWQFCPVRFMNRRRWDRRNLDPRQILPIEHKECLTKQVTSGPKTIVSKVKLHQGFRDLGEEDIVVFKEYQCHQFEDLRKSWEREINAFAKIRHEDNIVKYIGAFEQNNKCVVVLEYANGGTLRELFQRNQQPQSRPEVIYLWESLVKLLNPIHHLHHLGAGGGVGCAHRDIKPANILVFETTPGSFENLTFKISDFDASTDIRPVSLTETSIQDNGGSRTYAAPEACRFDEVEESDLKHVSLDCDVWSLGCVFSEVLVWLGGQWLGLQQYAAERTKNNTYAIGSGYEACFHDRISVLPCVRDAHEQAIDGLKKWDDFSPWVRCLIEDHMLQPGGHKGARLPPLKVLAQFERIDPNFLQQLPTRNSVMSNAPTRPPAAVNSRFSDLAGSSREVFDPSNTSSNFRPNVLNGNTFSISAQSNSRQSSVAPNSPNTPARKHFREPSQSSYAPEVQNGNRTQESDGSRHDGSINTNRPNQAHPTKSSMYPEMTIAAVLAHRDNKLPRSQLDGFSAFSDEMTPRHFLFVIDDSESMRPYTSQILNAAQAYFWIVKDIGNIELRFASEPRRQFPRVSRPASYTYRGLVEEIRRRFVSKPGTLCNMEKQLNVIFNDKVIKKSRPTSVLVFTDGVWHPETRSSSGNVETSIRSVVSKMVKEVIDRTDFTIQFVRFGENKLGVSRLRYLDDDLKLKNTNGADFDIVDHKHHGDNVWSILVGAMSGANDDPGESGPNGGDEEGEVNGGSHHEKEIL